jgi:hypothetical protein
LAFVIIQHREAKVDSTGDITPGLGWQQILWPCKSSGGLSVSPTNLCDIPYVRLETSDIGEIRIHRSDLEHCQDLAKLHLEIGGSPGVFVKLAADDFELRARIVHVARAAC